MYIIQGAGFPLLSLWLSLHSAKGPTHTECISFDCTMWQRRQGGVCGGLEEKMVADWKNNHNDIVNNETDDKILPIKAWPICKKLTVCFRTPKCHTNKNTDLAK